MHRGVRRKPIFEDEMDIVCDGNKKNGIVRT